MLTLRGDPPGRLLFAHYKEFLEMKPEKNLKGST